MAETERACAKAVSTTFESSKIGFELERFCESMTLPAAAALSTKLNDTEHGNKHH